jgi:hypothetical protein
MRPFAATTRRGRRARRHTKQTELKKNTCPLCRTRVDERPIRDCAFEEELEVAIVGGRVAQVEQGRVTETTYDWAGANFPSA